MLQSSASPANHSDDADQRLARLCRALALVERLAGETTGQAFDAGVAAGYAVVGPIARRRFDARAAETAAFAATGIETLLRLRKARGECRVAASRLAAEMRAALTEMLTLIAR